MHCDCIPNHSLSIFYSVILNHLIHFERQQEKQANQQKAELPEICLTARNKEL